MTLPRFSLKYSACTADDLRTFLKNRGKSPEPKKRRDVYIRALKELDEKVAFRFLDLPPEMRVLVYTELLSCRQDNPAYPEILRSSRLIHKEAIDVLHSESLIPLRCLFACAGNPFEMDPETGDIEPDARHWAPAAAAALREQSYTYACIISPTTGSFTVGDFTPPSAISTHVQPLRPFSRLQLCCLYTEAPFLATGTYTDKRGWTTPSRFLTELVNACPGLRYLQIEVGMEEDWPPREEARKQLVPSLKPLVDLPSTCTLHLQGLTDEEYQEFWGMASAASEKADSMGVTEVEGDARSDQDPAVLDG